jgi:glycosyltransferase 2 family protein
VAVSKRTVTVLKLAVVALLMWYVFQQIPFEDRLQWRVGDEVRRHEVVEIVGPWDDNPVRVQRSGATAVEEVALGPQADGSTLGVAPSFLTYLHNVDPWLFALGAVCYFLTALIAGARWWWLLRVNGTDVTLWETLRYTWIGIFFNNVVPGATGGDVVKALYIMKRCPGHRVQVLVSVIVDRVLGLGSLALLGAVVVLFALDRFGEIALAIWGVIAAVALLGLLAFSKRLRSLVRLKWLLERLPHRVGHVLRLVDQAVFFYRGHKWVIAASLVAGVGNHVLAVGSVVFIGKALGVGMPTFEYFVLIPVINIVTALPIGPNGWGVGEMVYGWLFGRYGAVHLGGGAAAEGIMTTRGVALSVLYRLHTMLWSLLGGVFMLFEKNKVTRADIEREAELEQREDAVAADEGMAPPARHG